MDGTKGFLVNDRFISLRIIYSVSFFVSITAYSVATFLIIHRHQMHLKDYLSYSSSKYTLQWLIGLSVVFYISYILVFIFGLIDILINFMPFDPYELSFIGLTVFAFLYGFFGFYQPDIFTELEGKQGKQAAAGNTGNTSPKYQRSGLKKKDIEIYKKKIINYMSDEKPYLDRELSISQLADKLSIPRHFVTEVINNHLGKNFYNLVNEYRVEEVKRRLSDPKYKNLTILAIAYDSGFNSKSAFNTIFKDLTGQTPSQYMNEVKSNQK